MGIPHDAMANALDCCLEGISNSNRAITLPFGLLHLGGLLTHLSPCYGLNSTTAVFSTDMVLASNYPGRLI